MRRNGRNILRRGAAVAMAILLAVPALPARAAEAGKRTEATSKVSEMASLAVAAGAGLNAAGSGIHEILSDTGNVNGQLAVDAEIAGGG